MDAQPKNDRVIDLTPSGDNTSAVTLSTARLIFTPGNWSIAQAVTITAAKDHNRDDETVTFNLSGARIADSPRTGSVTVRDNNAYNKLILDKTWLGLDEGTTNSENSETGGTFTVKLSSRPSSDRTADLESPESWITLNKTSLTFTPSNWKKWQTVHVGTSGVAGKNSESATINITGDGWAAAASLAVTVIDDDVGLTLRPQRSRSMCRHRPTAA